MLMASALGEGPAHKHGRQTERAHELRTGERRWAGPGHAEHVDHESTGPVPRVQTQPTSAPWVRTQRRAGGRACGWRVRSGDEQA
ncbi:uncharacterized protein B0H18DRAFT_1035548, partial [Fomitopsis serialis]|uniref:uncharacterized protein n=1 Tax=Fomitopsis serialis TaxID=139415 RepID=UPI002008937C